MRPYIFTSVVSNYLPKARVLAESVKRFHPELPFYVMLSDAIPPGLDIDEEPFDAVLTVDALDVDNIEQWLFQHSLVEASTGVKGFVVQKLLALPDCSGVLYFDPDIVVLAPLDDILAKLAVHSLLLTPHQTVPERDMEAVLDNEICSLKHGVFNLGFVGVGSSSEGRRFADWWAERLRHFCIDDIPNGLFTDQRWLDLAPAFFDQICILRSPVYNVSTWNLSTRRVEGDLRGGLTVDGEPIVFYHFSGFDSGAQLSMLDKYGATMPGLYELRSWYVRECERKGQSRYEQYPWRYGFFDNGRVITRSHRELYRSRLDLQAAFSNPYSSSDPDKSYYHWFLANSGPVWEPEAEEGHWPTGDRREPDRVPPAEPGECEYRVFCSLGAEEEPASLSLWLSDLLDKTYNRENITVLGPKAVLDFCRQNIQLSGVRWLGSQSGETTASRLSGVLSSESVDFAFISSAMTPPPFWDLRLFWTFRRAGTAATVSPLVEEGEDSSEVSISGKNSGCDLDRVSYNASGFRLPSWNAVVVDCCFIHRAAGRRPGSEGAAKTSIQTFVDNATRFRFEHVIADHVCATLRPRRGYEVLRASERTQTRVQLEPSRRWALQQLRAPIADLLRNGHAALPAVSTRILPRHLHVMHGWGGGLERWVKEYCRSDCFHENLVLKSVGTWGEFGSQLRLYRSVDDDQPVATWAMSPAIKATDGAHAGYLAAVSEIVREYGISAIIVSSFIGHSLDILRLTAPALVVCHDYYPVCAAINLVFNDKVCDRCGEVELHACHDSNPHNRFFLNVPPPLWLELREQFAKELRDRNIPMIAPTPSARDHFCRLIPSLSDNFHVIAHGTRRITSEPLPPPPSDRVGLKVVVPGMIALHKGMTILRDVIASAPASYEFYLVGCGKEAAEAFASTKRVFVTLQYKWEELPAILAQIAPDLGLLVSVVPETFGYTLQELMDMGIPALCTRMGSFEDRIRDGVNGFLADVDADAIVKKLAALSSDRGALLRVRQTLRTSQPRSIDDMLADYRRLLPHNSLSSETYFSHVTSSRRTSQPVNAQMHDLQLALTAAQTRVQDLESSLSWRVSAPLRVFGKWLISLGFQKNR
jgi:glycosyltransferase involved in cell wall biosynthesis